MPNDNSLHYSKFSLNDSLKDIVKYAWIMKSNEIAQSELDLLIPDGYPEIIFVLNGAYCKESIDKKSQPIKIIKSCFVGIQDQSIFASRLDQCYLIGLKLYPWSAFHLFKDKLQQSANKNIPIDDFGISWLSKLNQQLQIHQDTATIIELISTTLLQQIQDLPQEESSKMAAAFLKTILNTTGQISVQELAKKHCLSLRHFQRKFKQYYGITPKKFINIIRFKALYKSVLLQKENPPTFLDFGYYDQMHFIKDFRKQLGITPSYAREKAFLKKNEMAKRNL